MRENNEHSMIESNLEFDFSKYSKEIFQGVFGFFIINLLIVSNFIDLITWLTMGFGSVTIMMIEIIRGIRLYDLNYGIRRIFSGIKLLMNILMILGMIFGKFSAGFSFLFPYSYYFILSTLISISFLFSVLEFIEVIKER